MTKFDVEMKSWDTWCEHKHLMMDHKKKKNCREEIDVAKVKMIAHSLGHWEQIKETRTRVNKHTLSCGTVVEVELSGLWHMRTLQKDHPAVLEECSG